MKYIIGYDPVQEHLIGDFLIPKKSYDEDEKRAGKKPVLEVEESDLKVLSESKVFNDLLKRKMIRILDHAPAWSESAEQKASKLQKENTNLSAENEMLKAQLEAMKSAMKSEE